MSDNEKTSFDIQDRLAALGEQFNTNASFGMMGVLEAQNQQQQAAPVTTAADPEKQPDWFEPINASVRVLASKVDSLHNDVSSLRTATPAPTTVQQPFIPEGLEADDPVAQHLGQQQQAMAQVRLNTAWERARNSLNAAKIKHGNDFDVSEDDLKQVWQQHIGGNVGAAEGTNWDLYFQQQYDSRMKPKLEQRMAALQAENEQLRSGRNVVNDMGAVPRGNRQGAPAPASNSTGDFDSDIYDRAVKRMGSRIGSFKGFNRILVEEQNKKALRSAS